MPQIKRTDIYEGGNPFQAIEDGIEKLTVKEKELIASNKALQDSYNAIAKTNDGKQAKDLIDVTEKLTAANKELETVQKAKLTLSNAEIDSLKKLEQLKQAELNTAAKLDAAEKRATANKKKTTQSNIVLTNSLNGMRLELRNLIKEYDNLSAEQRNNIAVGGKLQKQITNLNNELGKSENLTGRNTRNVGNYKASILEAIQGLNLYNTQLADTAGGLIATAGGAGKATNAMKIFKIALASTGIGLLIIALGTLYTYFTKFDSGMEKMEQASAATGAAFTVFFERMIDYSKQMLNYWISLFDIIGGVSRLIYGIITLDFSNISKGLESIKTGGKGVKNSVNGMIDSFKGMGAEMFKDGVRAVELQKKLQDLEDVERDLNELRAKQAKELAEAREILNSADEFSAQEKLKALQKVAKAEKELAEKETKYARDKYTVLKELSTLRKEANEDEGLRNEISQAYIELQDVERSSTMIIAKNLKQQATLKREIATAEKTAYAEYLKNREKEAKDIPILTAMKGHAAKIDLEKLNEYGKKQKEISDKSRKLGERDVKLQQERARMQADIYANLITNIGDEFKTLIQDSEASLGDFLRATISTLIDSVEAAIVATQLKIILEQFEAGATLNFAKLASATASLIGVKILAGSAKALISQSIRKKDDNNFADGGINIQGKGTGRSDSINANLSSGESVISAYPTSKSMGLLTAINANKLTDATAPQYFNNSIFDSEKIASKLDETNMLLRNGGYAYESNGFMHVKSNEGRTISIKIEK